MKCKAKTVDCHLEVKVKLSRGEFVNTRELDQFSRVYLRGFLKPKLIKKNQIVYTGPVGVSLYERLKNPVSKKEFFFIMEHIVIAIQKLLANKFAINNLVTDIQNVYINEVTKEVQFIYIPLQECKTSVDVMAFVESIVYSIVPMREHDQDYITRFVYFFKNLKFFDTEKVEKFIEKEDRSVVNAIKMNSAGQSGFITSKQKDYYDYYDKKQENQNDIFASGINYENDATDLLAYNNGMAAASGYDDGATGLLGYSNGMTGASGYDDGATGLLGYNNGMTGAAGYDDGATGLLGYNNGMSGAAGYDDGATGLLGGSNGMSGVSGYHDGETSLLSSLDATISISSNYAVRYPSLYRVLTKETINIDKPVFRIGKERSYVDYFVSNNNAVSRSHADIIIRGKQCYIKDLNSKNRTFVNNIPLFPMTEQGLHDGDTIKLGNEEFIFHE